MEFNFTFEIVINLYNCKNGCSKHGTCNDAKNLCRCDDDYRAMDDCSVRSTLLRPNELFTDSIKAKDFAYFRTSIPTNLTSSVTALFFVVNSLNVTSSSLYLSPHILPTLQSSLKSVGPSLDSSQTVLRMDINTLLNEGNAMWYIGIYNPNQTSNMTFTLKMSYEGTCPTTCTAPRGTCNPLYTGLCDCSAGWQGAGCDVGIPTDATRITAGTVMLSLGLTLIVVIPILLIARWIKTSESGINLPCCSNRQQEYAPIQQIQETKVSIKGSINKDVRTSYSYAAVSDSELL